MSCVTKAVASVSRRDVNWYFIFILCFAIHILVAVLLSIWEIPDFVLELDKIPERFARIIMDRPPVEPDTGLAGHISNTADRCTRCGCYQEIRRVQYSRIRLLQVIGSSSQSRNAYAQIMESSGLTNELQETMSLINAMQAAAAEDKQDKPNSKAKDKQGKPNAKVISSVVRRNLNGIKFCYERELNNNPNLQGKVIVLFTIGMDGNVSKYEVESSTINNFKVETCILEMVRRWKFPAEAGRNVTVAYPFVFSAAGN